ncbi:hypothetical protein Tco_0876367 [Tanacetum coccineum]|uniref:Uncharacterized protein n=1 Tax=Tanacetum coccineum TaxID=301880 RepID=A0ABQ5BS20_9ASTR
MASFDYRLNPLFTIKECSSCGSLYNKGYCCTPDSSQQPLRDCPKCGNPVEGPNCQGCALWRKKLKEVWFTICHENGIYQDLLNTYESSDDDTNVVNAPREPFVVKQDPGINSSQSPPLIDHHCCYECGDSLNDIFCQRCTYRYWKIPICYDDDDDEESSIPLKDIIIFGLPSCVAITPALLTKEPVDSLIMEDEHLDTILATKSDVVIKSSVENLVPTPSESEGIPENVCDMPLYNNPTPLEAFKEHSEIVVDFNDDSTSSDDDSPYGEDIDYVDASPPDSELVSLEVVENVIPEVGGIDTDILLTIKDDILHEKMLNVNLLIANIEALKDNPTPSSDFVTKSSSTSLNLFLEETNTFDNSLTESETFCFDLEENSSGSTTTRSDLSLPDYEAFYLDDDHIEEKSSGSTTTHADFSQYDSFIFNLLINSFPLADRSDFYHEDLADELAHIISPPEYDCFYFKSEPDPGELTSIVDSGIRENVLSTTNVNLPFEDDQSLLLAYVVWISLAFLTYPVTPPYLLSCGNEDTIFDPGISIYHSFMPGISHRSGTFMKFNVYPNRLNESLTIFYLPLAPPRTNEFGVESGSRLG